MIESRTRYISHANPEYMTIFIGAKTFLGKRYRENWNTLFICNTFPVTCDCRGK
jgi:hypothetical protein